jgi:hypothetical protein
LEPRYSKEDVARRGRAIYARDFRPHIKPADEGKFMTIDIETGAYGMDRDDYTATERLLAYVRTAQVRLLRVGHRRTSGA